jgi:hypothetical protein
MNPLASNPNRENEAQLIGLARLARMAFAGTDLGPLKAHLLERISRDARHANALMDLSAVLQLMGQREAGISLQAAALEVRQLYRLDCSAPSAAVRLLAILSPGDLAQNNVLEFLIEESDITLDMLYVGPDLPLPASVPDHDLAMVAICETDRNRPLLKHVEALASCWPRPLLCAPDRIARLSRDGACRLLHSAPGIVVPVTRRLERDAVAALGRDAAFPLIARPVDSQKGQGLMKLDNPDAVEDYLKSRPESAFYVAPYVDYRGPDGQFRKYRIVLIDQRPYVCHMAISDSWVVHYMSAGMLESAVKRAEEARFFETFDGQFAYRHRHALASIARKLELEYVGIDCGETPAGELLVFEVDSGMTVHAMDSIDIFPYKQPQMRKVFRAFRQMLMDRVVRPQCVMA